MLLFFLIIKPFFCRSFVPLEFLFLKKKLVNPSAPLLRPNNPEVLKYMRILDTQVFCSCLKNIDIL